MKASRYILWGVLGFVAAFVLSASAWADSPEGSIDVAVFELEGDDIEEELLETLTAVLRQEALQHGKYSLVTPTALQRNDVALIVGCDAEDVECLRQMADYVDGRVLIFGEVRQEGGDLLIFVDILDAEVGQAPVRVERRIASAGDPVVAFQREVSDLFRTLDSLGETHLVIRAPGDDIPIRLRDVVIGHGEVERRGLPPGEYEVALGKRGSSIWEGSVELVPGQIIEVSPTVDVSSGDDEIAGAEVIQSTDDSGGREPMAMQESTFVPGEHQPAERLTFEDGRRSNLGAYSLMSVGALALAGSGLMVYLMRNTEDTIARENAEGTMTEVRYDELISRGRSFEMGHYVLLSAGIAGVGVGGAWVLWNLRRERSLRAHAPLFDVHLGFGQISLSGQW